MSANFDTAINRLLKNEGGYSNDPNDPGGETNWGISKRSYPNLDIKNLTRVQAIDIYRRDFWDPIDGDALSLGVGFQLLDFAVNSGISTAIRALQRALRVADDGHFGPVSQAALAAMPMDDVIMRVLAQRIRFLVRRKNWASAGGGWMNRMADNLEYGAEDTP